MDTEAIYDLEPAELASVFEAAFTRLGELGRNGGEAVCAKLRSSAAVEVEEGLAQLDDLYAPAD